MMVIAVVEVAQCPQETYGLRKEGITQFKLQSRCGEGKGSRRKWLRIWNVFGKALPCVQRSWPHCSAFLLHDSRSITLIVLTLNRLEGQEVQLSAEQEMLLLRTREKRKGGLSYLPLGLSPQVTETCNIHPHHQALWLGCNKKRVSTEKENKCHSHLWGS